MPSPRERLTTISGQVHDGRRVDPVTVRTLLSWFAAQRRGSNVVQSIRYELKKARLKTEPDFESAWIDKEVRFLPAAAERAQAQISGNAADEVADSLAANHAEPTYRISKLEAANRAPVTVTQDAGVEVAVGLMMSNDFSQLPVMQGPRDVKGIISWNSIGKRLALRRPIAIVRDCMVEYANEIAADASLFAAIDGIVQYEYVLVRLRDQTVSGIVTMSDLSRQFRTLSEPFLLLGEIENHIRRMIDGKFSNGELIAIRDPSDAHRTIRGAADLSFGEYVRLLGSPENWSRFNLPIDRGVFVNKLDRVRGIRNDVVHFDPDGTPQPDLETLRTFGKMLQELSFMGAV